MPLILASTQISEDPEIGLKLILVALGILTIAGICTTGKRLSISEPWTIFAAASLAFSPLFIMFATQIMSDAASTVLITWIIACCVNKEQNNHEAIIAGFLTGLAVLVRVPNGIIFIPIIVSLVIQKRSKAYITCLLASGFPAFILWVLSNNHLYDSFVASSYGSLSSFFSPKHVLPTFVFYAKEFTTKFNPIIFPAFVLSLFWIKREPRKLAVLVACIIPILFFYATYYFTQQVWWYARFVMPILPSLFLASTIPLQYFSTAPKHRITRLFTMRIAPLALAVFSIWHCYRLAPTLHFFVSSPGAVVFKTSAQAVVDHFPEDTLIISSFSSGSVYYYTDLPLLRWDFVTDEDWDKIREICRSNGPTTVALLHDFELEHPKSPLVRNPNDWEFVEKPTPTISIFKLSPKALD